MKTITLILCLVSLFPQTQSDPEIALILGQELESQQMIRKSQAEGLLRNIEQVPEPIREKLRVALTISLGTDPTYCTKGQIDAGLCLPEQGSHE